MPDIFLMNLGGSILPVPKVKTWVNGSLKIEKIKVKSLMSGS
jgi:hypothetical protein